MRAQTLVNANGEQILPVTHERLVFDSDGVILAAKLNALSITNSSIGSNLLLNSNFRNPVNRNGLPEYMIANGEEHITIDNWLTNGTGTITINDGYITLTRSVGAEWLNLLQKLPGGVDLGGKVVTFSALYSGECALEAGYNSAYHAHVNGVSPDDISVVSTSFTIPSGASDVNFVIKVGDSGTCNIYAAKLEVGMASTIALRDENDNWILTDTTSYAERALICSLFDPTTGAYTGLTSNAVSRSGDTMNGDLTIENDKSPGIHLSNTISGRELHISSQADGSIVLMNTVKGDRNNRSQLVINTETTSLDLALRLYQVKNGEVTYHSIIHTGNLHLIPTLATASIQTAKEV